MLMEITPPPPLQEQEVCLYLKKVNTYVRRCGTLYDIHSCGSTYLTTYLHTYVYMSSIIYICIHPTPFIAVEDQLKKNKYKGFGSEQLFGSNTTGNEDFSAGRRFNSTTGGLSSDEYFGRGKHCKMH